MLLKLTNCTGQHISLQSIIADAMQNHQDMQTFNDYLL